MTITDTYTQYNLEASKCRDLFQQKMKDYGTAWRILRLSSLIDQLYIKATRIRNIEENKVQKVQDSVASEYIGIVNYSLMSLIQMELGPDESCGRLDNEILFLYDQYLDATKNLMLAKNHDYGEVWRLMRRSSLTDLILMKILRMRQIFENDGRTQVSEGLEANLMDMINYALFALIMISEIDKSKAVIA